MKVSTADKELTTSYSASIRGRQDINIYPQVSGTIQELCVSEGETVRAGQTLFVIDQVPYKAALNTAEANVKAAEAALASAELKYESNRQLYERKVVSDYTLKTAENEYLTAQAQLAQMQAQQVNAANNLSYTVVKSPCDGVVGTLPYRVGALVSSAMATPLTTVSDNSSMYVYFSMTENQLLSLIRQYGSVDEAHQSPAQRRLHLRGEGTHRVHKRSHRHSDGNGERACGVPQQVAAAFQRLVRERADSQRLRGLHRDTPGGHRKVSGQGSGV